MKDYHINVFYSEEDEGYIADISDLRYCSATKLLLIFKLQEFLTYGNLGVFRGNMDTIWTPKTEG